MDHIQVRNSQYVTLAPNQAHFLTDAIEALVLNTPTLQKGTLYDDDFAVPVYVLESGA